jgi:Tol biopolymer transport system component
MAIFATVSLGFLWIVSQRPASRVPRHIARLTYSGRALEPKIDEDNTSAVVTDGSRLFFSHVENAQTVLAEALIANGEIREFKLPSEIDSPIISSISPDQGNLIVHNALTNDPEEPVWIIPALGGNAQRVPNLLAHDAAWMPDGKRILYARDNGLFVVRTDGTDAQKFADLPGWAFWLRWSPDGNRLRFSLRDGDHQTTSLWEIDSRGGNLHQLLPGWTTPSAECCGSWTADGRSFVFQSHQSGHSDLWMRDETSHGVAAPVRLTNGPLDYESPVTSPTGRRVYFIGANANIELLRFDSQLNRFVGLENTLSAPSLNVYSRDGQWVAWLSLMDGSLWRSRVDGSERLQLTTSPIRVFMMRWSPDNKQLAVMAQQPGSPWKIYIEDAAGGRRLEPILPDSRSEADPNWSTDGSALVFGRAPKAMSTGQEAQAIQLVNLATHQATEVPGSAGLFSPRLSPNGRYIAAIDVESRSLMLFDHQASTWRKLSDHAVADPLWSADGKYIYFQDDHEQGKPIYRVDIVGGNLDKVATLESLRPLAALDYRLVSMAPGDLPVVSAWTSNVNLYSIDLDQ